MGNQIDFTGKTEKKKQNKDMKSLVIYEHNFIFQFLSL